MEYQVVEAQSARELTDKVSSLLKQGWVCQGGLTTVATSERLRLYGQAMIHESNTDTVPAASHQGFRSFFDQNRAAVLSAADLARCLTPSLRQFGETITINNEAHRKALLQDIDSEKSNLEKVVTEDSALNNLANLRWVVESLPSA